MGVIKEKFCFISSILAPGVREAGIDWGEKRHRKHLEMFGDGNFLYFVVLVTQYIHLSNLLKMCGKKILASYLLKKAVSKLTYGETESEST